MSYTVKDFEYHTPPRIMGSETEYNIQNMTLEPDYRPHLNLVHYREDGRDIGDELWLENGARLYFETSGLTEYATPEVTSATELLAYERAGEQTVQTVADGMANATGAKSANTYKRSGYNIPEHERVTAGHHENFITSLPEVFNNDIRQTHRLHRELTAYLSTRGVWAGGGIVRNDHFELTQKMNTISFGETTKTSSEGDKPAYTIIKDGALNRLEVRLGDGNMSDWAIIQKYAFTSLVLRLIEHGDFPSNLLLPIGEGEATLRSTARLQHIPTESKQMHPALHQRLIAEAALEFAEQFPETPTEEIVAAQEIIEACHSIENLDSKLTGASELADRIDWAAKLSYLRARGIDQPTNKNLQAVYHDLKWEDIAANGIARKWYSKHNDGRKEASANYALFVPPATRAMGRTATLAALNSEPYAISWHKIDGGPGNFIKFDDPYSTSPTIS